MGPKRKRLQLPFQPEEAEDFHAKMGGYLPYSEHPVFDSLADDWLHVLSLELPGFDALPHVVTLGAFHVMLYQLRVSRDLVSRPLHFICEVVAPKKTLVREQSSLNYQENSLLPQKAVEAFLAGITSSERWQQAKSQASAFAACKAIIAWEPAAAPTGGRPRPAPDRRCPANGSSRAATAPICLGQPRVRAAGMTGAAVDVSLVPRTVSLQHRSAFRYSEALTDRTGLVGRDAPVPAAIGIGPGQARVGDCQRQRSRCCLRGSRVGESWGPSNPFLHTRSAPDGLRV
jgi:hypothetical protein